MCCHYPDYLAGEILLGTEFSEFFYRFVVPCEAKDWEQGTKRAPEGLDGYGQQVFMNLTDFGLRHKLAVTVINEVDLAIDGNG